MGDGQGGFAVNENVRISVVVVNFNRAELLRKCLSSLLGQTLSPLEVIVVDNGSTDLSQGVVESLEDPRVSWYPLSENIGFGRACNEGIRRCRGDFVALLNNDAEADSYWLERLAAQTAGDRRIGMWASKILFHGSSVIDKAGHLIYWDGQNRGRGTGEEDRGQYDEPGLAMYPDGCAALYRRELLDQVEGFDDHFFAYADDADLGLRAQQLGWQCRYVPDAVVYHRHSSTTGSYAPEKIYLVERNRLWLAIKLFPWPLLVANPLFTVYRWAWNLIGFICGRGVAGNFRKEGSASSLATTILRANLDAIGELGRVLRQRKKIRVSRRIGNLRFLRLLWRFRISARRLAFQDRKQ